MFELYKSVCSRQVQWTVRASMWEKSWYASAHCQAAVLKHLNTIYGQASAGHLSHISSLVFACLAVACLAVACLAVAAALKASERPAARK
jgi:hypothetical protein